MTDTFAFSISCIVDSGIVIVWKAIKNKIPKTDESAERSKSDRSEIENSKVCICLRAVFPICLCGSSIEYSDCCCCPNMFHR